MKDKNWEKIARQQAKTFFAPNAAQAKADMDRMVQLYTNDVFDDFLEEPICNVCGDKATQRCSRCKQVWYCCRECQLKDWKKHKPMCEVFSKNKSEDDKRKDAESEAKKKAND